MAKPKIIYITPSAPTAFTCLDTHKGEGDNGGYMTVIGKDLGVLSDYTGASPTASLKINGAAPANYRYLVDAQCLNAGSKLDGWQALVVQVGACGNAAVGTPVNVTVTTAGGTLTVGSFVPTAGSILYASKNGVDSSAVRGDIANPYRHLQTTASGGISGVLKAGDQVVILGDGAPWVDLGVDGCWFRTALTAHKGSTGNFIGFVGYPGAINGNAPDLVHYVSSANKKGGFHGPDDVHKTNWGGYFYHENLWLEVDAAGTSDAAPMNHQETLLGPVHTVNCRLGPWPSNQTGANHPRAAGISGHAPGSWNIANDIGDIDGDVNNMENHGVYADHLATGWVTMANYIHDISAGNLYQCFDDLGSATPITNMEFSFNYGVNAGKYGRNYNANTQSWTDYCNFIENTAFAPLAIDLAYPSGPYDIKAEFNTHYNGNMVASGSGNVDVFITNTNQVPLSVNPGGSIVIRHNIVAAGPDTVSGTATCNAIDKTVDTQHPRNYDIDQNLYGGWNYASNGAGGAQGWTNSADAPLDANALFADSKVSIFKSPVLPTLDPHLKTSTPASPAIDAATSTSYVNPTLDFFGTKRPKGGVYDIGAVEQV